MANTGKKVEERQELSPELKAIEAKLWAEASPHERAAAILVGKATDQKNLPHILADLRSVAPKDALEARLAALAFALTHAAAENLNSARVLQPYPDSVADRARLAAVRMTEAACKCVEALARHRSGGTTEHRVTVTHTGPAAEVDVGVRLRRGGEGDGRGGGERGGANEHRPQAPAALAHEPGAEVRCADPRGQPLPVAGGEGEGPLPDAWRGEGQRRAGGAAQRQLVSRPEKPRDHRGAHD
jgi:hypothetical protein